MTFYKLRKIGNSQHGFTLIELLVALAIASVLMAGIATTIYQMFSIQASTANRMYAVRQVQNVGYWISRDVQSAQSISLVDDEDTTENEFLTINWTGWNGIEYEMRYILNANGNMYRDAYKTNVAAEKILVGEMLIAEDINKDETNCLFDADTSLFTLSVTAKVGGFGQAIENRIYEVIPRFAL